MINPNLEPWNFFNNFNDPKLGISNNVIIDNHEWYNSFMPCFFELKDLKIIANFKKKNDSLLEECTIKKSKNYSDYNNLLNKYQQPKELKRIFFSLKERVNHYFNIVEATLFENFEDKNFEDQLAFILAGLNLMQEHMDPIETLTTLKKPSLIKRIKLPNSRKIITTLEKTPSIEIAYIPMAVAFENKSKTKYLEDVFNYFLELFDINQDCLIESIKYSNLKYSYTRFMNINFAQKIIKNTAMKINSLSNLDESERMIYSLQEVNGLMTWSKNILTNKQKHMRRYDSTNNILYSLIKQPYIDNHYLREKIIPKTISGSEKQGILIFLLNHIKHNNIDLFNKVKIIAEDYYKIANI